MSKAKYNIIEYFQLLKKGQEKLVSPFHASFEAFTAMMFQVGVFWVVTHCTTRRHNPEDPDLIPFLLSFPTQCFTT